LLRSASAAGCKRVAPSHPLRYAIMMTDLASVLPALKEPLILTWLKRDLADMTADAFHEDLLCLRGGDDQAFKRTLALNWLRVLQLALTFCSL
jgi:hypothetical protein